MARKKAEVVENVVLDTLPEEVNEQVVQVCPNCEDSGRACSVCHAGDLVD